MVQTVTDFVRECTLVTVKGGLSVSMTIKIQPLTVQHVILRLNLIQIH